MSAREPEPTRPPASPRPPSPPPSRPTEPPRQPEPSRQQPSPHGRLSRAAPALPASHRIGGSAAMRFVSLSPPNKRSL
jgi:hypothetical protein